jgi:hypothetical protein
VRPALAGAALGFVFDRPRQTTLLAEGLERDAGAVLLRVGLHLPRLVVLGGVNGRPEHFLAKLGTLARLALSAGVQKRAFLRRLTSRLAPALGGGFLLDRARLVAVPIGLDRVVSDLTGRGLAAGGAALDLGRQALQRLRDVLRLEGRRVGLETCLDGPFDFRLGTSAPGWPAAEEVAGLTPWDATATPKGQWRAGGVLHAVAEGGTLALFLPADREVSPEEPADWLGAMWRQTEVQRVRILPGERRGVSPPVPAP